MKKCSFCAEEIQDEAIKCKHCGSMLVPIKESGENVRSEKKIRASDPPKNPLSMAIVSLLIPGLAQIIIGQTAKGITILALNLALAVVSGGITVIFTWPAVSLEMSLRFK